MALTDSPSFPTYPNPPSQSDITAGLAAAYAAAALLGKSGAVALLIVLFMAVTSCASAELIAVSSLLTFDVYKAYLKPTASPKSLIFVSHVCICIFGFTMAIFAVIWNAIGIDLGWLFLTMGLIIGGAVFPVAFAVTWSGQSTAGAISGALSGLAAGLIAWLVTAKQYFGEISVYSTGQEYSTLAGNLAAIMTGLIVTTVVSLIKPQNFDWEITRAINSKSIEEIQGEADDSPSTSEAPAEEIKQEKPTNSNPAERTAPGKKPSTDLPVLEAEDAEMQYDEDLESHPSKLRSAFILACVASFVLTFIMDFLVSSHTLDLRQFIANLNARFLFQCSCRTIDSAKDSSLRGSSYLSSGSLYPLLSALFCRS